MKKLLFLFLFLPLLTFSQEYIEVVEMPGKTSDQLYSTAREWFAKSFITTDNSLLMDDRISGKIIAKGSVHVSEIYVPNGYSLPVTLDWYPNFTIKVSFKNGRYKNEITDISITSVALGTSSEITTAFKVFLDKKVYYKNADTSSGKIKTGKVAAQNQAIYNLIGKTEIEMKNLLDKLQQEMKKPEAEW